LIKQPARLAVALLGKNPLVQKFGQSRFFDADEVMANALRFNSGATVSPCARRLKTTPPKTSAVNSVGYGSDSGRLSASAIESDPRNPPQNK